MYKNFILPIGLLAGTIIGAGIFALPYAFNQSGLLLGFFYLIFLTIVMILMHLMYADIIARTPKNHRFAGYAKTYLGNAGFYFGILMTIIGAIFSLVAYLVLSVSFINLITPDALDNYRVLIFWFLGSITFFLNISKISAFELFTEMPLFLVILLMLFWGLTDFNITTQSIFGESGKIFFPFGIILFSLAGRVAIPAVLGYFRNNGQSAALAKKPIILGTILPAIIYALFIVAALSLVDDISPDVVSSLKGIFPTWALFALVLAGAFSLWSTYIVVGRDVKKSLEHDLNINSFLSTLIVSISALLLYFAGFNNFISLIELVGGVFIGLEGIFIILMWKKASKIESSEHILTKIHPIIIYLMALVFASGIIYAVIY
ncbi:MAG: aromatic amino acid transport family protein [Patescibacteria group bacterium]